jgi:hypothetical protein
MQCPPTKPTLLEGADMIEDLDELDKALLDRVKATQCSSIRDVIRPFLLEISESVLRTRVRYLELHKLIKTTKTRHGRIKCLPVE